jgi:hypothetical protein
MELKPTAWGMRHSDKFGKKNVACPEVEGLAGRHLDTSAEGVERVC